MYAVTGITGKVGGTVAQLLLAMGKKVRAVVRDEAKGSPWADKGCEVSIANIGDADALAAAFAGTDGVFLMTPPNYDPEFGFPPGKGSSRPETGRAFLATTANFARQRLVSLAFPSPKPGELKDYSAGARKPDLRGTAWWGW